MSWLDAPLLPPEPWSPDQVMLDASVLIAYLTAGDAHLDAARDILNADEWVTFAIHPYTLAESLVGPSRVGDTDRVFEVLAGVGIERWAPDPDYPRRIAAIRATTRLALADCCPLDAAEQLGARLATFDTTLARVARERGVEVLGAA